MRLVNVDECCTIEDATWREPVSRTHMVWMYRLEHGEIIFLDYVHPSDHVELLGKKEITITEGEGMG